MENIKRLIGKTIIKADKILSEDFDDAGCIRLKFSDGTTCCVNSDYGPYTGKSQDEYPTLIGVEFDE